MSVLLHLMIVGVLSYLALSLMFYLAPLMAVRWKAVKAPPKTGTTRELTFAVVSACRDGADCLPGLVESFRAQDYPASRIRLFLAADHCTDRSAETARSLGMQAYERNSGIPGKGNAVSEILMHRLRTEAFDVLIVLDVDARVEPSFLSRMSAYFQDQPLVLSCATFAKNPDQTLLAHVGDLIQALLRLYQEGRAALGVDAILYGSHGYALSRAVLDRLGWRTTTGLVAEDMELRLRCTLAGFPIRYARDLPVYNDVTVDAASVHDQRLRWNATYPPLIGRYAIPLARGGHWEALWGVLMIPTFANLFLCLMLATLGLGGVGWFRPAIRPYAGAAALLWACDVIYFFAAFRTMRIHLGWRELAGFAEHLWIRARALVGGVFKIHIQDWVSAPHPPEEK